MREAKESFFWERTMTWQKIKDKVFWTTLYLLFIPLSILGVWALISSTFDPFGKKIPNPKHFFSSIYQTSIVSKNDKFKFSGEYEFLFTTGAKTYIPISPDKIDTLENILFSNSTLFLPEGMTLLEYQINIEPKKISWEVFDGTATADGLSIKVLATIRVNGATKGNSEIAIELPRLSEVEQQLNANATFPNQNIRNGDRIILQKVSVYDSTTEKFFAIIVRWFPLALFIVIGILFFKSTQ